MHVVGTDLFGMRFIESTAPLDSGSKEFVSFSLCSPVEVGTTLSINVRPDRPSSSWALVTVVSIELGMGASRIIFTRVLSAGHSAAILETAKKEVFAAS